LERERFAEFERRTSARVEAERAIYDARIHELERGGGMGSGSSRRG
jgi:hypothetical protein